jgi:hypothetical protein
MKRTLFAALAFAMLVGVAIVLPLSTAQALETFLLETETRLYRPDKSYNGYFMPQPGASAGNAPGKATHFLLDRWGQVVKQFDNVSMVPRIQPDGTIWSGGQIQDWDSNILWDFVPTRDTGRTMPMHHDWQRMWNKKLNQWTMLIVVNRNRTNAEAYAAGGDPGVNYESPMRLNGIDFLIEVNMAKQVVWEWDFMDHTAQSKNPAWKRYVSDTKLAPGKMDVHWLTDNQRPKGTAGFVNDWAHVNSADYDHDTGHVVVNPKHFSQMFVIDHDKTMVSATDFAANKAAAAGPDGDIIYRWGNPSSYNAGEAPGWLSEGDSQGYGWHAIQFIRPYHWEIPRAATDNWPDPRTYVKSGVALPGAGNFLYFDNGCYNPSRIGSRIIEINGRIGASGKEEVAKGKYVDPLVAGYGPATGNVARRLSRQQVWRYQSTNLNSFYSQAQSYVQRLPNGNTVIHASQNSHYFEVTPGTCTRANAQTGAETVLNCTGQEVVWEYIYPGFGDGVVKFVMSDNNFAWQTASATNPNVRDPQYSGSLGGYRSYNYGADFPGFAGKDLTPGKTLTGRVPRLVGDGIVMQTPSYGFGLGSAFGGGGGGGAGGASGGGGGGGY